MFIDYMLLADFNLSVWVFSPQDLIHSDGQKKLIVRGQV